MNNEQLTQLLQQLVRIPSVNPAGQPGTSKTGEGEIARFIAEFLHKLGLDVEVNDVLPGRPNVLGRFQSQGQRCRVTLAPHTDTVSVAGMVIDPFGGEVRDGRLYGRGACDTKASIAVMLAALARCVRRKEFRTGRLDVDFVGLMGEETGSEGARALCATGYRSDFAIAGEPTNCRVVHAHKGSLWFRVITRGRSCHGSTPELGENAVAKMAEAVRWLHTDYAAQLRRAPHPLLGPATVNIGVIRGGNAPNIVPDLCEIEVDRRTVPGEQQDRILSEIRQHIVGETEVIRNCPPLFTPPDHPFIQAMEVPVTTAPWFCDAAVFAEHGVPAVAFGPGNVAQAHTDAEFVDLTEVFRAADLLEQFLMRLATT